MPEIFNQVYFPNNMQALFSYWSRYPNSKIFSIGSSHLQQQYKRTFNLPKMILDLDNIDELKHIDRTERFLEIGAMVSLNKVLTLGKIVPQALRYAFSQTKTPQIRNLITIGSALCQQTAAQQCAAAMVALDSRCELRTVSGSRWVSASRLYTTDKKSFFQPQELLSRVRIPLEQWDYCLCRHIKPRYDDQIEGGFAVFLARIEKDILCDVRIVFSGGANLRDKNSESMLIGKKLPIDIKNVQEFTGLWEDYLNGMENVTPFLSARLLNFIESTMMHFVD
ncbi:hypothetical protein AGMMS50212_07720 [Spirochaetia bacterium]|nr:hypothetical protein AGMMS50212_07720 [Spirochaetia bacterium]